MINIRSFQREINEIKSSVVELSNRLMMSDGVKTLANQELNLENLSHFTSTFIFFTEKKETPIIEKIIRDIGVTDQLNYADLFQGKIRGSLTFGNGIQCSLKFFHCDHFPLVSNLDLSHIVKVIVYDKTYVSKFRNWQLVVDVLEEDPAVLIFVELDRNGEEERFIPKINCVQSVYYDANTLKGSVFSCLWQEGFYKFIQLTSLKKYVVHARRMESLLLENFESQFQYFKGRSILLAKEGDQSKASLEEFSSIDLTLFKAKISEESKKIAKLMQERLKGFDNQNEGFQSLKQEVNAFLGFVETKKNKAMAISISEGAVKDKVDKAVGVVTPFFQDIITGVREHYINLGEKFQEMFEKKKLGSLQVPEFAFSSKELEEIVSGIAPIPGKTYEQSTNFKGVGTLLTELRKPLYMLMPLMMVFALFGALTKSEDKGSIDESKLFCGDKPCIAIDGLPQQRNGGFLKFINDVEELRKSDKGIFNKELSGEMVMEPQLAVKEISRKKSPSGKIEIVETVDYYFDKKSKVLYLHLNENSDRKFVIDHLFNPANKLLRYKDSSRGGGFGISGIIKVLSSLKEYRFLIIFGLSVLIIWFVITRKKGMDSEFQSSKTKDQQKLNGDLLLHIDKSVKQSIQKFQVSIMAHIRECQSDFLEAVEVSSYKKIRDEKSKRETHFTMIQQKIHNLRTEKMEFSRKKKILAKLDTRIHTLQTKIDRSK